MIDFQKIYERMLNEEVQCLSKKVKQPENERITIDNFCDENTTDIAESGDDGVTNDDKTGNPDGWGESVQRILNDVFSQADSLNYEIKNCAKGSYSQCKTTKELAQYLKNLSEKLNLNANEIENL